MNSSTAGNRRVRSGNEIEIVHPVVEILRPAKSQNHDLVRLVQTKPAKMQVRRRSRGERAHLGIGCSVLMVLWLLQHASQNVLPFCRLYGTGSGKLTFDCRV